MARPRRGGRASFRWWGTGLAAAAVLLAVQGSWTWSAIVSLIWVGYLLFVRLTRCGVETARHRPCRWRVRGLLATCEFHVGDKTTRPTLRWGERALLPTLMWPRPYLPPSGRAEPQPRAGSSDTDGRARSPLLDRLTVALAVGSLLVAVASLARDLLAG